MKKARILIILSVLTTESLIPFTDPCVLTPPAVHRSSTYAPTPHTLGRDLPNHNLRNQLPAPELPHRIALAITTCLKTFNRVRACIPHSLLAPISPRILHELSRMDQGRPGQTGAPNTAGLTMKYPSHSDAVASLRGSISLWLLMLF